MEIARLKAKNFGSFEDIDLNLSRQGLVWIGGENRDTQSASNNGSGKSTLARCLCWGLYGDTIEGEKTEKVVRKGSRSVSVEVELREGKSVWQIKRSRTLTGNLGLELILPDGSSSKDSKQAIQRLIEDLMGMDFFAFRNTVMYGQNDLIRFADQKTTDPQRKAMLFKILRTEILQDCHEIIKKQKKKIEEQINRTSAEIREVEVRIEEKDVVRLQEESDEFEKQRAIQIHEIKSTVNHYKKLAKREIALAEKPTKIELDLGEILARKGELVFLLEGCDKADLELVKTQKEKDELEIDLEEMREALIIMKEEKKSIHERLNKLNGDLCPLCESGLTKGAPKKVVDKLNKRYDDLHKQQKIQEDALNDLTQEKKELRKKEKKLSSISLARKDWLEEIETLRQKISKQEQEVERADQTRENHLSQAKSYLEMAKTQKVGISKAKKMNNPYIKRLDEIKEQVFELEQDKKEFEKFIELKSIELAHYRFWNHGFSNQGMPSFFLDSVMPFITSRANKYLQTLSDGDIVMNFSTQKMLKRSKDYRDKINIEWTIEGLSDSYPPSGGQLKKMSIATDLALMDLVSAREGDNINLLVLDEVLDGLDSEGCDRVVSLLTSLRKTKDTILVISHEPNILEPFEKSIQVVKEDGISRIV